MKYTTAALLLAIGCSVFAIAGCGSDSAEEATSSPAATESEASHDHDGHGQSEMDEIKAELAKLSPEDAESAEKQRICPVSDEMLGSMGAPKKVDVKGQQVWICCDGCKDSLLSKPEEFLAKLKMDD